jgi:hypothetical protein
VARPSGAEATPFLRLRVALAALEPAAGLAEADLAVATIAVGAAAGHAGGGVHVADLTLATLQVERAAGTAADARGDVAELARIAVVVPLADAVGVAVAIPSRQRLAVLLQLAGIVALAGTATLGLVAVPVRPAVVFLDALLVAPAAGAQLRVVVAGEREQPGRKGDGKEAQGEAHHGTIPNWWKVKLVKLPRLIPA